MGKVVAGISMSLDGFVSGPNVGNEHPMGEGGMRLHDWLFDGKTDRDEEIANEAFELSGSVVMGRRTFDVGEEPWGEDGTFGMPCFVVTHTAREVLVKGPTTFTFVTDGLPTAVDQAQQAAGDKNVWLMGGAEVIRQAIEAKLLDELQINLVNVLLGQGNRLFDQLQHSIELERLRVVETPSATHIKFHILK